MRKGFEGRNLLIMEALQVSSDSWSTSRHVSIKALHQDAEVCIQLNCLYYLLMHPLANNLAEPAEYKESLPELESLGLAKKFTHI